ncbi:hypothetical protein EI982_01480 [Haloplanus rallus]|uniref:MBL fold metallo-hydrolase n=1 Tax=Haloplanus rallus TaxID=1816183 RepID=A0A6B9F086_9EURY|nr:MULTISPECIES: hypothetical protein [Haloplanus]QGX93556.1 hypothetical protein EI982_01480 [Haloplanus rallus]
MPLKGGHPDLREIDRWDGGVGWIAYPDERMQRASHALVGDDGVWVVDPVDAPGLDDLLAELGDVAGVAVCLDRHERDAGTVAARHDAPVYIPEWMDGVAPSFDVPVERFGAELGDSGYRVRRVRDASLPPWQEAALYTDETLLVPEAVGTASFFRAGSERLGVHPMLRPIPPRRALADFDPERVLVGHGEGVVTDAGDALRDALDGARRRLPAAYANMLREMVLG